MNRFCKLLCSLLGLTYLLALAAALPLERHFPRIAEVRSYLTTHHWLPARMSFYYHCLLAILFVVTALIIVVIWCLPKPKRVLVADNGQDGKLELTRHSLARFAEAAAVENGLTAPRARVKARKHKVRVLLRGTTARKVDLKQAHQALVPKISDTLTHLLGDTDTKVVTKVVLTQATTQPKQTQQPDATSKKRQRQARVR